MKPRVLVHMGHVFPREPGFESGTGTGGEIEFVTRVGTELFTLLKKDGRFQPTLSPGKLPRPLPWKGDVVLSLHADGSASATSTGYSLGWRPEELGPKTKRLLALLTKEYEGIEGHPPHHTDNYTGGMREYYGHQPHRTVAGAKILIEHGFLTNPKERQWLEANTRIIARAWYRALLAYFRLPPKSKPTKPTNLVDWVVYVDTEKVASFRAPKDASPIVYRHP